MTKTGGRKPGFEQELSALVSKEIKAARDDPERAANIVERLLNAAGLACAMTARGDPETMSTMLEGMEGYLYESAAGHAKLAAFLSEHLPKPPPTETPL